MQACACLTRKRVCALACARDHEGNNEPIFNNKAVCNSWRNRMYTKDMARRRLLFAHLTYRAFKKRKLPFPAQQISGLILWCLNILSLIRSTCARPFYQLRHLFYRLWLRADMIWSRSSWGLHHLVSLRINLHTHSGAGGGRERFINVFFYFIFFIQCPP